MPRRMPRRTTFGISLARVTQGVGYGKGAAAAFAVRRVSSVQSAGLLVPAVAAVLQGHSTLAI